MMTLTCRYTSALSMSERYKLRTLSPMKSCTVVKAKNTFLETLFPTTTTTQCLPPSDAATPSTAPCIFDSSAHLHHLKGKLNKSRYSSHVLTR
ncbi:hypothetical protein E2C01_021565 [Portunus trituberculatus]|uniref:Uncharacterized protein n=1 Tax=Portunus trituberculatus TaxID=210409 RepID=A0A5B7E510_PORTR|nr:hypothetical protein [Portunus trituberculatus]